MGNKKHLGNRLLAAMLSILLACGSLDGYCLDVQAENHSHDTFTEWNNTSSMPKTAGSYYLSADVELSGSAWSVPQGTVNLCLNGHTIRQTTERNGVIVVPSGAELNLYDEKDLGKITGGEADKGGGVKVESNGSFIMNGGNITENTATYDHTNGSGGGVCVSGGNFTMNGGMVSKNAVTNANGGGVVVRDSGTFLMTGGKITGNSAGKVVQLRSGGGVYISAGSSFTMAGGEISDNDAANSGGGVNVDGTFTLNGGTISGNIAMSERVDSAEGGGGIFNGGTVIINGGTITGNKAKLGAGVLYSTWSRNPMTFSGNPVIKDNVEMNNETVLSNLYLMAGKTITITDSLTKGADIGVTVDESEADSKIVDITGTNNGDYSKYFVSDNPENSIKNSNNVVQIVLGEAEEGPFRGQGTEQDPYWISSKEDLQELGRLVNEGTDYSGVYFNLTEDIDLGGSAQEVWTPIGTEEHPFKGNFNGDGHIIKELHINTPSADNLGLFGVNAGTIENLTVEGSLNGKDNIGGIAGTNTTEGTIKDCTSNVTVSGQNNVGGIVGKNEGTVTGCINKGDVTGSGTGVGGVAGTNLGALDNDRNTASVTGKDQVGGITGTNGENGTVQGCVNSGNVTGEEGSQPGAIIGNNQNQNSNGVKDDYYQKTETVNKDLTGIGQGTGAGTDPDGITSGEKETPGTEDEEKVAAAKKALQEALEKIIVSNDTSKEDIQSTVEKVLTNAGITGVTVSVDDFSKIEATTDAAGSISANIVLTDGSTTDTVEIAKTIEKLLVSGVSDVRDKINAIGEVTLENAESKKELIEAAREAYDKLTDEEKEEITPAEKKKLTDAEKLYDDAVEDRNQAAAAQVSEKINEIPNPVQNNQETKQKIEAAREAYDALTPAQKDMVPEETKKKLEDAEKEYNRLVEADRLAADEVKQKIEAIGEATPENVTSKKDLIEDAREAYDKLNEEQKGLITPEEKKKLTDAEKLYDDATGGHNQAAADKVTEKIDAIPDQIKNDEETGQKIEEAKDAYENLTGSQQDMVPEASREKLENAKEEYDKLATEEVKQKIEAIGEATPENVTGKKDLIEDAREAYDKLNEEQKELITAEEKKKLTDAEKLYDNATGGHNQAAADKVTEKIDAIPDQIKNDEETKQKIEEAKDAYENLTGSQQDMVPEASREKLENAKEEYDKLATEEVKQKIEAIGEATPENVTSKKDLIEDAREAYDKLNEEQKGLITPEEKKKLTDAEKLYDNATGGKNQAAADQAKQKIDAIPDPVKADWDSKSKIEAARDIYDSLTSAQKDMVPEASKKKLTDAEKIFRSLVSKADETAVLAVVNKVNAIGKVVKTDACGKKIKDARSSYNLLTQQQKKLFPPDILKKLTDAEQAYSELNKTPALPPEQQKQIEEIADKLGVSKKEAEKIQKVAKQLGIEPDVLLVTDKSITGMKSENDVKGAVFGKLQVKCAKVTDKKITLKWKKVKGADGYLVYGTPCGKGKKPKLIKTLKKNSKTTFTQTKRKKGTPYRYIVRAYKLVGGKKITISIAKTVHVFTNGGKYTNAKSVKVNKTKVSIKKGKKFKLKATEVKANKKKKIRKHRVICYESTNKKIATVTKKGVIKGKKKGTCKIYVYTQNGVSKTVKVTVK